MGDCIWTDLHVYGRYIYGPYKYVSSYMDVNTRIQYLIVYIWTQVYVYDCLYMDHHVHI